MTTTKTILILSIAAAFVIGMMVSGADDAYAKNKEKLTKLQKECSKEPKKEDKIKAHCELLNFVTDLQDQVDNIIAIPGPQGEQGPPGEQGARTIILSVGASDDLGIFTTTLETAYLFFGEKLSCIDPSARTLLLEFGSETIVEHNSSCTSSIPILLTDGVDLTFKLGDRIVVILNDNDTEYEEVFRQIQ